MCLVFFHHQRPDLIVVSLPENFQAEKAVAKSLLEKVLWVISGVLEVATTEKVESTQWSHQLKMKSSMVLISDAPSESEARCLSTQGKVFNVFPDNGARNVSTRCHLQIALKVSPVTIRVLCHRLVLKRSNGRRLKTITF
jgi:hypothetical protein